MSPVRLKGLGPAARAQVEAALAEPTPERKRNQKVAAGKGLPGRCSCGETFATYLDWEKRHPKGDGTSHQRWSIDLDTKEHAPHDDDGHG